MTHVWISPQLTHTLGWALLHFLWQGLALAAICSAWMALCRTASARYVIAIATLLLMLVAPVVTFFVLQHSAVATVNTAGSEAASTTVAANLPSLSAPALVSPAASNSPAPLRSDTLLWLVEAWFAGVFFFSLRTAGGLIFIERMRRNRARPVSALLLEKCLALQRRMGLARAIRYCECLCLEAPAVIGWLRPVVLLPVTALSGLSEDQLAAVISHELAHIRRFDCFVNLFQIAAETLLFYHPAVWWLNKRIRAERENCCDDAALAICGNAVEYARALTLMEEWRQQPVMAMAANRSPLVARVARLLGIGSPRSGIRSAGIAASILCLVGALLAANGLMAASHSSAPTTTGFLYPSTPASNADAAASRLAASLASRLVAAAAPTRQFIAPAKPAAAPQEQAPLQDQSQFTQSTQSSSSSYIDQMKAQGYDNLTADELISMKVQGVTPEYISEIKALGLHPTVNELISMRVQGIDPQYIKDMRATGFNADINQLIGMRVQGVTPEYVRDMRAAGIDGDANQFISLKVQGIEPDYVKEMKAAGFSASLNQLVGMKVQGITPDYVREMRAAGVDGSIDKFISFKVQGVTPDYIKEMKATGFNATPRELISMKVQGITPDYVREMRAAGIDGDVNEFISFKVQGVTPDYIKEMKAAGVTTDAGQLIGMRVEGVTPDYVKSLQSAGFPNLKARDYIRARISGITPEFIATVRSHGFKDLTMDKLIDLKDAGVF
ncbi:MAG: M56 family metallopeptidase [Candidatus Acidiferrales bacterium]